ncbi:DUF5682 family protein [Methylophilus glucosoxydans]|uniref:DUF5682 family protein n=1 Tax=Methylophilus glucosoxydans TaxID=752553 RepID=A0ABW3GDW5_9PROT
MILDKSLTSDEVRALADSMQSENLIIFPVRHHSPACALQLTRLLKRLKPAAILVEGPRSFNTLIAHLTHPDAKAPLAVYTYHTQKSSDSESEEVRKAAFYPFCDYSPELVALKEAHQQSIPVQFIDLNFSEQCSLSKNTDLEVLSLLDEHYYTRSRNLQVMAERAGCRNHEEFWEHLFETHACGLSIEEHIAQIVAYCQIARRDTTEVELKTDGTLERELEMAWHIEQSLLQHANSNAPVIAVMGGFHAVVMPSLLIQPIKRPHVKTGSTEESCALIRYSFDRLDRLNGYSAGMTSPAWHQKIWEQLVQSERLGHNAHVRVRQESALTILFDIALLLREKYSIQIPVPAISAAYEHLLRLAKLRERIAPVREDLVDAVTSCFIKGDTDIESSIIKSITQQVLCGNFYGTVPAGIDRPPLVKDFESRARQQKLKIGSGEVKKLSLDIYRRPDHRITSRLLHGLNLLKVPFGVKFSGPDYVNGLSLDRMQEQWEYVYSPVTEGALIEAAIYGVSIPVAVANKFVEHLDSSQQLSNSRDSKIAASLLIQACLLGLHDHLSRVLDVLRYSINEDAVFSSVVAASMQIAILWDAREPLEARHLDQLPAVLQAAYERAIYLMRDMKGAEGDGGSVVQSIIQLRELLNSSTGAKLDASLYWQVILDLQQSHDLPLIRGASAGLRYASGQLSDIELTELLQGYLTGHLAPDQSIAFLRGLLQTSREVAWQQETLLKGLDTLFSGWDESTFAKNLPELRLAFAEMTPKETDKVAEAVAKLYGIDSLGSLTQLGLNEDVVNTNLRQSALVEEILLRDGFTTWL